MQSAISLIEAKRHLRIEHDLDDEYINFLCKACTDLLSTQLRREVVGESDTAVARTTEEVPELLKVWVCMQVASRYEHRESETTTDYKVNPHLDGLIDKYKRYWHDDGTP